MNGLLLLVAVFGPVAAGLGLLTAVLGLINQHRVAEAVRLAESTADHVQEISVQVDGRLSALLERQAQLLGALHEGGVPVPERPPDPDPPPELSKI